MLRALNALPPDPTRQCELRAFMKLRDESTRLPHILDYYRRLGVDRFVVADNESTDGTRELLLGQPDVHVFSAEGSFRAASGGQAWLDELLDCYGSGHWCLTVDADELLCYAGCERRSLPALCAALEREGAEALSCVLLDMYGSDLPGTPGYVAGEPFLSACPWFDAGPYRRTGPTPDCPPYEVYGGVRQRVFYPRWQAPSFALRLSERIYDLGDRFRGVPRKCHGSGPPGGAAAKPRQGAFGTMAPRPALSPLAPTE